MARTWAEGWGLACDGAYTGWNTVFPPFLNMALSQGGKQGILELQKPLSVGL